MKKLTHILSIAVAVLIIPVLVSAQSTYTLDESSSMTVSGTSTLHDWEADVEEINLSVSLNPEMITQENPASPVSSLQLNVPVKSLESGKGKMNRKMKEALKEEDHPSIIFDIVSTQLADSSGAEGSFTLQVTGNLTLAGFEKEVSFPVTGMKEGEQGYRFEGSYSLNMTEYNMDPPSVMFGTIKCGEEVTISFNLLLTPSQNQ